MKVILLNRYFFPDESATSRIVSSLAFGLARRNHSVQVLTSRSLHDGTKADLPALDRVGGVTVHRLRTTAFGRSHLLSRTLDYLAFHVIASWRLLRVVHPGDLCVVCTDPPLLAVSALVPVVLKRGLLVNWIMDLFPEVAMDLGVLNSRGAMAYIAARSRDFSLRVAGCNVAPTDRMARSLQSRLPGCRFAVINHWSDGDAIRPIEPAQCRLRQEWGLAGKVVIGYSGNLGRAHEFGTILDAANRLKGRRDIVFLFVGSGHRRPWVERKIKELAIDNVVLKPLQPRERLAECLALPDIHLVSLRPEMETFIVPSKFYGIAAAGRPTLFVGDPNGEIASLVRDARCGTSVEIGQGSILAQRIVELGESPSTRRRMGNNARKLFDSAFSEARGLSEWKHLIGELTQPEGATIPTAARGIRS